jgi:hypothetical protein
MRCELLSCEPLSDAEVGYLQQFENDRALSRRSFMCSVAGGLLAGALPLAALPRSAFAQNRGQLAGYAIEGAISLAKRVWPATERVLGEIMLFNPGRSPDFKPILNTITDFRGVIGGQNLQVFEVPALQKARVNIWSDQANVSGFKSFRSLTDLSDVTASFEAVRL